jgi:hypothetical protein
MAIPEHLRFALGGFSAKRVSYALAAMGFAFLPVHFYVSCEVSGLLAGFSIILFLITGVVSLIIPRGTEHRFRPLVWAFVAVLANSLCSH